MSSFSVETTTHFKVGDFEGIDLYSNGELDITSWPTFGSALSSLVFVIAIAFLIYYAVYMSVHIISLSYGFFKLHRWKRPLILPEEWPGVSIIKPIIGIDKNLKENLESYFKISYPKFELLLCVAEQESSNPPSLVVINDLLKSYPQANVRVFMGALSVGVNPKINNMLNAYQTAQYELLWLSDSNIKTHPDTLTEMVTKVLPTDVGLVHQIPFVGQVESFADYLEMVYFGSQHSRVYLLANLFGQNCATGMSWLIKKTVLEREGGLISFANYLAEDFFMGKALWERGWKLSLSSFIAIQNSGSRTFSSFKSRLIRWGRLRSTMMPFILRSIEPFTECFLLGLLGSLTIYYLTGWSPLVLFLIHCFYWFTCDVVLMCLLENGLVSPVWKILLVWLIRETSSLPIYVICLLSSEITWRGARFRLHFGGNAIKID